MRIGAAGGCRFDEDGPHDEDDLQPAEPLCNGGRLATLDKGLAALHVDAALLLP